MLILEAKEAARDYARGMIGTPGFLGAYISGSVNDMSDSDSLPDTSDVDVAAVFDTEEVPEKPGKLVHNGVLLEVTYQPWMEISDPETVLSTYELAGSFRKNSILCDPSGRLAPLQEKVGGEFAHPDWVRVRWRAALDKIRRGIAGYRPDASYADRVNSWLFPTGITTHVLLVAGLRNPTVRKRYEAAGGMLRGLGMSSFYEEMLALLGCAGMDAATVRRHLENLAPTFDLAAEAAANAGEGGAHFPFSADIAPHSRHVAIGGSREQIDSGLHREAVFWIGATFARCHKILEADAPELHRERLPLFHSFMAELGIASDGDFAPHLARTMAFLPRLEGVAEDIIAGRG